MILRVRFEKPTREAMFALWEKMHKEYNFDKAPPDLVEMYFSIYREILSEVILSLLSIGRYHTNVSSFIDIGNYTTLMENNVPVGYWELCEYRECPLVNDLIKEIDGIDGYDSDEELDRLIGELLGDSVLSVFSSLRDFKPIEKLFREDLTLMGDGLLLGMEDTGYVVVNHALSGVFVSD